MTKSDKELRKEMDDQFVRGLFLINGGGVVALLAFIQAILRKPGAAGPIHWTLAGIGFMLMGLVLAAIAPMLRRHVSLLYETGNAKRWRREKVSWGVQLGSVFFFVIGAIVVVCGLWGAPIVSDLK